MRRYQFLAAAAAATLGLVGSAQAATIFSATLEAEQSTNPDAEAIQTNQFGQGALSLVENTDGSLSLAMTLTFTGDLDFSQIVAAGLFSEVLGTDAGAGGDVVTGLHLHNAPRGAGGPVVFSLFETVLALDPTSDTDGDLTIDFGTGDGTVVVNSTWDIGEGQGTFDLTDFLGELLAAQEGDDIGLYFNLHTVAAPSGLIRGQLVAENSVVPIPGALPLFAGAIALGGYLRRRKAA